jgi:hypothetical protein
MKKKYETQSLANKNVERCQEKKINYRKGTKIKSCN